MLLLVFFAFLSNNLPSLLLSLLALSLHELCHALMARGLGYAIAAIELEPFGFVAQLEKTVNDRWDELLIAASGPLFSLIAGLVFLAAKNLIGTGFLYFEEFGRINLWIAAVNLLPALPLDGGRAAKAAVTAVLSEKAAVRLLSGFGMAAGSVFFALGAWLLLNRQINPTFIIWGLFLPLAALREWRAQRGYRVFSMIKRMGVLKSGGTAAVHCLAVHQSLNAKAAMKLFGDSRYVVLYVVDDEMKMLGELDEASVLNGLAVLGQEARLCDILRKLR